MDILTDSLKTVTITDGGFGRRDVSSPWTIGVPSSNLAIIHIVVKGNCWLILEGKSKPAQLKPGQIALLPHGTAHKVTDDLATMSATPKEKSCSLKNVDSSRKAETTMACGYFNLLGSQGHPLLSSLPPLVHINKSNFGKWLDSAMGMIAQQSKGPGSEAFLDQMGSLLFIQVIREYVMSNPTHESGWLAALHDPVIGKTLERIHDDLTHPWTVASLAASCAMSRSAFASRFKALLGISPVAYVIRWRMHRAAHLLRSEGLTIQQLCEQAGYRSEATFAKAFKRFMGVPPAEYRRTASRDSKTNPEKLRLSLFGSLSS
jgi:AraC-like DNA-binding protein